MCGFNFGTGIAISDATSIGIMGAGSGCAAATAVITIQNRLLGGGGSSAYADSGITFTTTPVLLMSVTHAWLAAVTIDSIGPVHHIDLDGKIVVPPGGYVAAYTATVTNPACLLFGFIWEEVDA